SSYAIQIFDTTKPVIKISGSPQTSGKVGQQIVLPAATATDDYTSALEVHIQVVTNNGRVVMLKDRAFTPKSEGKYTVCYWCIDEAGNMQTVSYTITVEKGA
ncbi:MAG: hypothetical protein ACI4ST_04035, partial [Candidatus Gallimonas sp.]